MEFFPETLSKFEVDALPRKSGVYLFMGRKDPTADLKAIYIGKAKNLWSRVRQYFLQESDTRAFVRFIRERTESIQYVVTASEDEALILENDLIKKFKPAYNIQLKDDKRFLSLRLDLKHEWPRVEVVRKIRRDGAAYLGPFSSAQRLRATLEFLQKTFPLRTCTDHKLYNRSRPCIEYELKRCVAPCVNLVTRAAYQELVCATLLFLRGKNDELKRVLEDRMAAAVETERFEEAAHLRDTMAAIQATVEGSGLMGMGQFQRSQDQDALGVAVGEDRAVVSVLFVRAGVIFDRRNFEIPARGLDREQILEQFIERYYSSEVYVPHEVLVPVSFNEGVEWPKDLKIVEPRSGERREFLETAQRNADTLLEQKIKHAHNLSKTLGGLQKLLGLERFPTRMDCFDISHHQGAETVASVVRFQEGMPDKSQYRRMNIHVDGVDDFASMKEVISRRYKSIEELPDLILIDGGKGQLSAAGQVLSDMGWLAAVDLRSLAKARDREGMDPLNPQNRERIFRLNQKNPILLRPNSAEELLVRYLRDEAHRFAITFHRKKKTEALSASALDEVPGLKPLQKQKLLREFGSLEGIVAASDLELLKVIPEKLLLSLRLHFGENQERD